MRKNRIFVSYESRFFHGGVCIGPVRVQVNGTPRELSPDTTVAKLLEELSLASATVAVERNRAVVPKRLHSDTLLMDGDTVEVVSLVGGG